MRITPHDSEHSKETFMNSRIFNYADIRIGELVAQDWRTAQVFRKYDIDFCCGGKRTVKEACQAKGVSSQTVERELRHIGEVNVGGMLRYDLWDLDFLADYIVNVHHTYIRNASPFLSEVSQKVLQVHGDRHPELRQVQSLVAIMLEDLALHMEREEMFLFPYVRTLAEARRAGHRVEPPIFGSVVNPISLMEQEHHAAGNALACIEEYTSSFMPPDDACTSYRVLYAKLAGFRDDLHQHVHLENNILFPAAIMLEEEVLAGSAMSQQ